MKSIRFKLFTAIILILGLFLSGLLFYRYSFKGYFQEQKLRDMEEVIYRIETYGSNNTIEADDNEITYLASKHNVQIEISDSDSGDTICTTHTGGRGSMCNGSMGRNKFQLMEELGIKNGIERKIVYDKSTGVRFLTSYKETGGYDINISTPINIIDEAVASSLRYQLIIFIPLSILLFVITAMFSKRFTRPILKINEKTAAIENLDFGKNLEVKGKDEISQLGNSVNNLSSKIESTLHTLNDKNIQLQDMIDEAEKNGAVRREFVSSISHELKSPLAVISGYAQVLQSGAISSKEDVDYYIGIINEETERMGVIVSDLLDLYKLESNTFKLNIEEFDIYDLMESIVAKNKIIFKKQNIRLKYSFEHGVICGDKVRIEQALQNYINNGLAHIKGDNLMEIAAVNKAGKTHISVYNSGENIPDKEAEIIWNGFVRGDKVRNYKDNRVGLGLAIVKEIVRLHKGSCFFDNCSDGVKFWIELPLKC